MCVEALKNRKLNKKTWKVRARKKQNIIIDTKATVEVIVFAG